MNYRILCHSNPVANPPLPPLETFEEYGHAENWVSAQAPGHQVNYAIVPAIDFEAAVERGKIIANAVRLKHSAEKLALALHNTPFQYRADVAPEPSEASKDAPTPTVVPVVSVGSSVLHRLLQGLDPYASYGVPSTVWELIKELVAERYGEEGTALLLSGHEEADMSVDVEVVYYHSFNLWEDAGRHQVTPEELIERLEAINS